MSVSNTAFRHLLSGPNAFYNQPDYLESTKRDFNSKQLLPTTYKVESLKAPPPSKMTTTARIAQLAKNFFNKLIYQPLESLAGKAILPATWVFPKGHADKLRSNILPLSDALRVTSYEEHTQKFKRITIEVDGVKIDAVIIGTPKTLGNGKWVLVSNGNEQFYEDRLNKDLLFLDHLLSDPIEGGLGANAIIFNYPGVGASSGRPTRELMKKAYLALLSFLETGVGANQVIGYGFSIGGGVQGDALEDYPLKPNIRYLFVKDRTFSDMSKTASILVSKISAWFVRVLGWNFRSVESSKNLKAPEIILQTAKVDDWEEITDSSKLIDDGVIPADASLAKALLDDPECPRKNKLFIGIQERHNGGTRPIQLAKRIKSLLSL